MARDDEYIFKKFYRELPPVSQICQACGFTFLGLAEKMGVSLRSVMYWNGGAHIPLEKRIKLKQVYDLYRKG